MKIGKNLELEGMIQQCLAARCLSKREAAEEVIESVSEKKMAHTSGRYILDP